MTESKKLYFIPIIERALQSGDPSHAMKEAFDEIWNLGKQEEYKEGFQQFLEFTKISIKPSEEDTGLKLQFIRDTIYRLIYDLATGTFEGDEQQKADLTDTLRNIPPWNAEFEHIKEEARALSFPEKPLKIEILRENRIMGSYPISPIPSFLGAVTPGRYMFRLSNGRVLWDGIFNKEDLIWAFAFPDQEFDMAAETEAIERRPTKTISLLDGEFTIRVFAGLESGQIRIESEKDI